MNIPPLNRRLRQEPPFVGNQRGEEFLDSRQMADWLGICLRTLSNLRNRQEVPFIRLGRAIRYQRAAVEAAFNVRSTETQVPEGNLRPRLEYRSQMRRRSKNWPRVYTRKYPISRKYPTGKVVYVADLGKQGRKKRDRRLFDTLKERDAFVMEARAACEQQGQIPFFLPPDAQSQANRLHAYLQQHGISLEDVQRHYAEVVVPFLAAPNVPEIVKRLMEKIEKKYKHRRRTAWPVKLGGFLNDFGLRFPGKITDIKEDDLETFCFRGDEPVTERDRRAMCAQLFNFAIKKGWAKVNLANNLDLPELVIREPAYLTVEQIRHLLSVADEFGLLAYFVLGLFLGIRPEELHDPKQKKPTLQWSDVQVEDGKVVIFGAAAKIGLRRELPINDTLAAWLPLCLRKSGPIVEPTNFQQRFKHCRAAAGLLDGWVQDVVRHSFATYHAAAYKNLDETARLMGHIGGLRILKKHYVAYVPEKVALEFWTLRPTVLPVVEPAFGNVPESPPKAP